MPGEGGRRQFFHHGELPLVILGLLHRRSMHGYELMAELDRLFGPEYRSSAGSVYPAISALVSEGLVVANANGGRRRLSRPTPSGRAALAKRRGQVAALEVRTGVRLEDGQPIADALERFTSRVLAVAERAGLGVLEQVLERAAAAVERAAGGTTTERNHHGR